MMKSMVSKFAVFATGAVIGSLVAWKLTSDKYENVIREEINSVKEMYNDKLGEMAINGYIPPHIEKEMAKLDSDLKEYKNIASEYSDDNDEEDDIYVVSPRDFAEFGDYNVETLYYNEDDGRITDTDGFIIEDYKKLVGNDFMNHFGDYETDTVHIRNDEKKSDFEIIKRA